MNSSRYKTLLSYLPGMAAIVNAFQSEQVQLAVFDRLIEALDEKTEDSNSSSSGKSRGKAKGNVEIVPDELEHDIVEGDSIHSALDPDD